MIRQRPASVSSAATASCEPLRKNRRGGSSTKASCCSRPTPRSGSNVTASTPSRLPIDSTTSATSTPSLRLDVTASSRSRRWGACAPTGRSGRSRHPTTSSLRASTRLGSTTLAAIRSPASTSRGGPRWSMRGSRSTAGPLLDGGVYAQTSGPRFETPAEVRALARDADLVGMTVAIGVDHRGRGRHRLRSACAWSTISPTASNRQRLTMAEYEAGAAANRDRVVADVEAIIPLLARVRARCEPRRPRRPTSTARRSSLRVDEGVIVEIGDRGVCVTCRPR